MYPARMLSFANGWEILSKQKPQEWQNIQDALLQMTSEIIANPSLVLDEASDIADFAALTLDRIFNHFIKFFTWETIRLPSKLEGGGFYLPNVKNAVSARVIAGGHSIDEELTRSLFIDGPRSLALGLCDVTIVLVPADDIEEIYGENMNPLSPFYEFITETVCRVQINELQPIYNSSPIVVIFFSQYKRNYIIEELSVVKQDIDTIERSIEFAPEYYQAGVGILSYFGEILRQKHPGTDATVRIEQQGKFVRMHIKSPAGGIEIIEKELDNYALVLSKQAPVESLLEDKLQIMALENKLEVAQMEVRQAYRMLDLAEASKKAQLLNLEHEVGFLRQQIGATLHLATQQAASHERVQLAQIGHTSTLFKELVGEAHVSQVALMAIRSLEHNLMAGIALIDVQDQISNALATIKQEKPNLLEHIAGQVESAGFGAVGSFVLDWISKHSL